MNHKVLLVAVLVTLALGLSVFAVDAQGPKGGPKKPAALAGTGFTYQGQLKNNSALVNATCEFQFGLWDSSSGGVQVGTTQTIASAVTNGLFTTPVDFGASAFTGDTRWLAEEVRCPSGSGSYTLLNPRQALNPAPIAFSLPGLYTYQNGTSPNVIGGYSGNVISNTVVGGTIGGGGNNGLPNRVWANYAIVGGGADNTTSGEGSAVGGGYINTASGWYSTIGGGRNNTTSNFFTSIGGGAFNIASGISATVGGGSANTASLDAATVGGGANNTAGNWYATVGGGKSNTATGRYATVGGGFNNFATVGYATVGGGENNIVDGDHATVPGGYGNSATMSYTFAAGRQAQANHQGTFVWADSTPSYFSSTANDQFLIRSNGGVGINTNVPGASLEVASGNYPTAIVHGTVTTNRRSSLAFKSTTGGVSTSEFEIGTDWNLDNSRNFYIYDFVHNVTRLTIDDSGNVAIPVLGAAGSTQLCRNASNQIATCSSSIRYKNNIANLNLGLDAIAKLRPVAFTWKDSGQADLGFVAEEVNQITPLLTTLNKDGQIEGVKYDRVSALLVKGVQEQQTQIEELQAKNSAQQKQIDDLNTRLTALEQAAQSSGIVVRTSTNEVPTTWVVFGGLVLIGIVLSQRRHGGNGS